MIGEERKSLVFDTSAMIKYAKDEEGSAKVGELFKKHECIASSISAFEIVHKMGREDIRAALLSIAFFEEFFIFISPDYGLAKRAAILKLKYPQANLSMADAIIIQTAAERNARIVTCDKEWRVVKEAEIEII
ncbi:MAG: PIN domain-containing protein [archaeon]